MAVPRPALAFRPHTGWSVLVVVSGGASPKVLHRERVELCPSNVERFVYHDIDSRKLELRAASRHVEKAEAGVVAESARVMKRVAEAFNPRVVALLAESRPLPDLERILTAHPLFHAAEGELFRNALALAAASQELRVVEIPPKRVRIEAERVLKLDGATQDALLRTLGKDLGPPWQRDHRDATLAGLIALKSR